MPNLHNNTHHRRAWAMWNPYQGSHAWTLTYTMSSTACFSYHKLNSARATNWPNSVWKCRYPCTFVTLWARRILWHSPWTWLATCTGQSVNVTFTWCYLCWGTVCFLWCTLTIRYRLCNQWCKNAGGKFFTQTTSYNITITVIFFGSQELLQGECH